MRKYLLLSLFAWFINMQIGFTQFKSVTYGDAVNFEVKVKYVFDYDEALALSKKEKKPIFFNCFADWAMPCHGMNKYVFSDEKFGAWLSKNFIPLILDVTKPENESIRNKYDLTSYPCYLVLDEEGNEVHRIYGGGKIPEFQFRLTMALNPKTTLAAMDKAYRFGMLPVKDYGKYAYALFCSGNREKEEENKIAEQYFKSIKPTQYSDRENFFLFGIKAYPRKSEYFQHLIANKERFIKKNSRDEVFQIYDGILLEDLLPFVNDNYSDKAELQSIFEDIQAIDYPMDSHVRILYNFAKAKISNDMKESIKILKTQANQLTKSQLLSCVGALTRMPNMSADKMDMIKEYVSLLVNTNQQPADQYKKLLNSFRPYEGITFAKQSLDTLLMMAKEQNKLVFVDCYTVWCGPCRSMEQQVFPRKEVGQYFNANFINAKIDMERGEGVEIAKKYGVTAFPTFLILDGNGKLVHSLRGGRGPEQLINDISNAVKQIN